MHDPIFITDEIRSFRAQVARFVKEFIVPHGDKWEEDGFVHKVQVHTEEVEKGITMQLMAPLRGQMNGFGKFCIQREVRCLRRYIRYI